MAEGIGSVAGRTPGELGVQNHTRPYFVVALIAAAVLLVGGTVFEGEHGLLNNWLFRWQGLLTGFFAVAAAYATIGQMRASDVRSDRRHEDLINLAVRAEKLKVVRETELAVPMLRNLLRITGRFHKSLRHAQDHRQEAEPQSIAKRNFDLLIGSFRNFSNHIEKYRATELHDAPLENAINSLLQTETALTDAEQSMRME